MRSHVYYSYYIVQKSTKMVDLPTDGKVRQYNIITCEINVFCMLSS